jgi:hypothetical protein
MIVPIVTTVETESSVSALVGRDRIIIGLIGGSASLTASLDSGQGCISSVPASSDVSCTLRAPYKFYFTTSPLPEEFYGVLSGGVEACIERNIPDDEILVSISGSPMGKTFNGLGIPYNPDWESGPIYIRLKTSISGSPTVYVKHIECSGHLIEDYEVSSTIDESGILTCTIPNTDWTSGSSTDIIHVTFIIASTYIGIYLNSEDSFITSYISLYIPLQSTVSATSSVVGDLYTDFEYISTTVECSSEVAAHLSVDIASSVTVASESTISGHISVLRQLVSSVTCELSIVATLDRQQPLVGTVDCISSIAFVLGSTKYATVTVVCESTVSAQVYPLIIVGSYTPPEQFVLITWEC